MKHKKNKIMKKLKKIVMPLVIIGIVLIALFAMINPKNNEENNMGQTVILETNKGEIKIKLYNDKSPISTENFLAYVNEGFYDGTVFHRVIDGFMVQGGGFTPDGNQKSTKEPIKNEADNGVSNKKYTLAMARTMIVDSATSQFFINVADNNFLDNGARDFGYAVFGEVIEGQDIVDAISKVKTTTKSGMGDWPVEDVVIQKAYVQN